MTINKKRFSGLWLALGVAFCFLQLPAATDVNVNPLFGETKIKNYLPHMTWQEVEQALTRTDMALIPVGSIEQHGVHLPLGTDSYGAIETCKLIAQKADVIVVPVVLAGLSLHHMAFPGTITLSPETFEAVVYETAQSLIAHGFKRILIYNGHGGNEVSVANVIQKINQTTHAIAVDLGKVTTSGPLYADIPLDFHAGVGETSEMLYLTPSLVDMNKVQNPHLSFPPAVLKLGEQLKTKPNLRLIIASTIFRPLQTGKKTSTREVTDNGAVTTGDIRLSTAERGRKEKEAFIASAVQFIADWQGQK